ncbi:MAG TPA: DUF3300 domain-containing protein, partial [Chthoniobacterales bacterium]|nr:DUF3300 domain-containing protein [Chthoniobacterales bacterium]
MKPRSLSGTSKLFRGVIAPLCGIALLSLGHSTVLGQQPTTTTAPAAAETTPPTTPAEPAASPIPNDQLDALVAPIAMYADPLLAQTLAASTYPLEIIQLQQWMEKNKNLKGKALADAVAKQPWDPSIQSMVAVPDVVKRLAGNIQWTTDLGNAFLAQQSDVLDAVQRMRTKAQAKGNLNSNAQQKVETRTEANKQVIVIEQADPQVVYVPSYDPAVIYGPSTYPYYPYSYPGYYPGMGLAFGTGLILGAGIANNWWGNCNWGGGDVNINNNNNFNRNNINNSRNNISNRQNAGGGNRWQHNSQHRGNTPYSNRKTSNQFGGGNRPTQRPSNSLGSNRTNSRIPDGPSSRPSSDRGNTNRSNTSRGPSASTRPSTRPSSPNSISNRSMSSGFDRSSAFGSGGGFDRGSTRASSTRGGGSMRSSGFSGGSRGGG